MIELKWCFARKFGVVMKLPIAIIFILLCCTHLPGQQPTTEINDASATSISDAVLRGQPMALFDGKTLDGWERRNGKPGKNWIVDEDGNLHRSRGGGDLYHQHWFKDFDLTWQWKLLKRGNSGIKYRVQDYGRRSLGCEYQMQDDKGRLFQKQSTGALYALFEPDQNKQLNPVGQWNTSRIVVCGYQVEHWLNGKKIMTATFGSSDWHERVAASKFSEYEGFGQNPEGRIFLQDHGQPVWFRNIELTPLDASRPAIQVVKIQNGES